MMHERAWTVKLSRELSCPSELSSSIDGACNVNLVAVASKGSDGSSTAVARGDFTSPSSHRTDEAPTAVCVK